MKTARALLLTALLALFGFACGNGANTEKGAPGAASLPDRVNLGYFANVTHASAVAGVEKGIFQRRLGPGVKLKTSIFNAGPAAVEALFAGVVDAAYIGPNPAINAYSKSRGEAIRIVSGAASGGASLVVREGIDGPADLKGTKLASPQLGNTQDVALRAWLKSKGLRTSPTGGGDVTIVPQENSQTLQTFTSKAIDGAWLPEPWVARLVAEAGAKVLVDESTLWPEGRFVTALFVVRTEFLGKYPEAVKRLVAAQVESNEYLQAEGAGAREMVNEAIGELTGKKLSDEVVASAWARLEFTNNPVASSLKDSADHAVELGLLDPVDLKGIFDLKILNELLRAEGKPEVAA